MNREPTCEEVADLVAIAIDGALPTRLETHVTACARCAELLRDATLLGDAIKDAADHYRHAPDFEARLLEALDPDGIEPTQRMRRPSVGGTSGR